MVSEPKYVCRLYIKGFVLYLCLISSFLFLVIYLPYFNFDISSSEFFWEDRGAVHARKCFLDMLRSHMWQNSECKEFALAVTIYVYWFLDLMQVPRN